MTAYVPSRSPATDCRHCRRAVFRLRDQWLHVHSWRSSCDRGTGRAEPIAPA